VTGVVWSRPQSVSAPAPLNQPPREQADAHSPEPHQPRQRRLEGGSQAVKRRRGYGRPPRIVQRAEREPRQFGVGYREGRGRGGSPLEEEAERDNWRCGHKQQDKAGGGVAGVGAVTPQEVSERRPGDSQQQALPQEVQ
jgi:hypothetical protein